MLQSKENTLDVTRDALYEGRLILMQPRKGYRFSVDSPLLTWFACSDRSAVQTADLGAGCGVVGLGILLAGWTGRVVALEVQDAMEQLARKNAHLNGLESAYECQRLDIRQTSKEFEKGSFDLVVSNPPFWPAASGRLPGDEVRRIACHEILGDLNDWVKAAAWLLDPRRGRFCVVFPARRLDSLCIALDRHGLSTTRLCMIHPMNEKPAELALVEARYGESGRMVVDRPLTLKNGNGEDTQEAAVILRGGFSRSLQERGDLRSGKDSS